MNSCVIIILGATGDLAYRRLIPAVYRLVADKKLEKFVFVGAAIEDITIDRIFDMASTFINDKDEKVWQEILKNSYYQKVDFDLLDDFVALNDYVSKLEKEYNLEGRRLIYLASPPSYFCSVTQNCVSSLLMKKTSKDSSSWNRIVYEKPFGKDAISAKQINNCIAGALNEEQVFRVDHYLTKEIVGNVQLVRFTNCVFEPLWNNNYIDQVNILLEEKLCVENRGPYYDKYGAMKDVVQNHMLALVSLIAMEQPKMLTADCVRDARVDVLKNVAFVDGIFGQYRGYKQENGVGSRSKTETFASLLLKVNNQRWQGVPFYLKTGKCLGEKRTEIQVKFKKTECLLLKGCPTNSNYLTINIYPEGTFSLSLNAKKPGISDEIVPIEMEFCHSCRFSEDSLGSYEAIFQEVMRGDQSISVRFDEIEYAWNIIDKIMKMNLPLHEYEKGSGGPKEIHDFEEKYGIRIK